MKNKLYKAIAGIMIVATLIFVLHPFTAHAAVARVQAFSGLDTTFASTVTTSPSVTVTAGDLIICTAEADVATSMSISDSKGNSFTLFQTNTVASTFIHDTWYGVATVGGSGYTVTATSNGGGTDSVVICEEWSGAVTALATVADKNAGTTGVASTAMDSGASGATTQAAEIVIGTGVAAGAPTLTLGAGYTNLTRVATTFTAVGFESKIVAATGAQQATMTAGSAVSWSMHVTTYKEAPPPVVTATVGHGTAKFMGGSSTILKGTVLFN